MGYTSRFAQLAALAEILFVLALGNITGVAIYNAIAPAVPPEGVAEALYAGLRIALRIGLIAAFGLALLWLRRGVTPPETGLTLADKPLGYHLRVGLLLGAFSSFLVGVVFAVHSVVPLGDGLAAWDDVRGATLDMAFYVDMLATSIVIPPLVEEIMARGYMRVRLVACYGPIGGVVLAGLVFALAHGKFISADPLLAVFLVVLIVSSISWGYIAQTTGSLIPSMVGHAITNTFATLVLFNVWIPFTIVSAIVVWQRRPILSALQDFAAEWKEDGSRTGLWFGTVVLLAVIAALMIGMVQFGRTATLATLGGLALAVTLVDLFRRPGE